MDGCELDLLRLRRNTRPVYGSLTTFTDREVSMQHSIYPPWDFMPRIKSIDGALAPVFHDCHSRPIHLDEAFHAPLSLRLAEEPVRDDPKREQGGRNAAWVAVMPRIMFWDGLPTASEGAPA